MKEIRGKKLEPKPTNSERIREMDVELKNLQVSGRVSQMLIQQMLKNMKTMGDDLGKAYGLISEMQYKLLAMQGVGRFDVDALAKAAEGLRLADFNEASDKADKDGNFTVGTTVKKESTVILTSKTAGEDDGIFRSRIELATCGVPALIEGLEGKAVGAVVKCELNKVEHVVELLGIRDPEPSKPVEPPLPEIPTPASPTVH